MQPEYTSVKHTRRYDLDWIRVLAVIALLLFHTGMLFVAEWDWHIKNLQTSQLFTEWMYFMSGWRMSLLFLVSGAGTFYALGFRSNRRYIRERATRLVIPLLFGMLIVVPPQIYFERLFNQQIEPGYLDFWLNMFGSGLYPQGDISWHHLWFIVYLFLYSIIALPLFVWLRRDGNPLLKHVAGWSPLMLMLAFGLPYAIVYAVLTIPFPGPQNIVSDWGRFFGYLMLFVYGFMWVADNRLGQRLYECRKLALKWGFVTLIVLNAMRWNRWEPDWQLSLQAVAFMTLRGLSGFCWALALMGYARQWLRSGGPALRYANEAVYPFYILHQTVLLVIGYYVVQVNESIVLKFAFTAVVTFFVSMGIYEVMIRPYPVMRRLFGLKPNIDKRQANTPATSTLQDRA